MFTIISFNLMEIIRVSEMSYILYPLFYSSFYFNTILNYKILTILIKRDVYEITVGIGICGLNRPLSWNHAFTIFTNVTKNLQNILNIKYIYIYVYI